MNILYEIVRKNVHTFMKKNIWTPTCVFNFFTFFETILYKSNYIIFTFSWCRTHTKIRSKLVVIVTAGSQKITLLGPQRTPLGILWVNTGVLGLTVQNVVGNRGVYRPIGFVVYVAMLCAAQMTAASTFQFDVHTWGTVRKRKTWLTVPLFTVCFFFKLC